jgi:hypothetical protein
MLKTLATIVKTRTTFDAKLIICISFSNKGNAQVGWAAVRG